MASVYSLRIKELLLQGNLVEQSTTIGNDTFDKFGRILITHPNGESASGSISLNVVNLQFVLSIGSLAVRTAGTNKDLGGLDNGTVNANGIDANGFIGDIMGVNVSQFTLLNDLQICVQKMVQSRIVS